jgi:hypothetical protein
MKPTFQKECRYCLVKMDVETKRKKRCYKCRVTMQKEAQQKRKLLK